MEIVGEGIFDSDAVALKLTFRGAILDAAKQQELIGGRRQCCGKVHTPLHIFALLGAQMGFEWAGESAQTHLRRRVC
jgi:hypothetical protein